MAGTLVPAGAQESTPRCRWETVTATSSVSAPVVAPDPSPGHWHGTPETAGGRQRLPYVVHVLAALVVAVGIVTLTGSGAIVNADEGAALLQGHVVHERGAWGMDNPNPELDPDGRWFPVDLTLRDGVHWYPYTKHVVYPLAVGGLFGAGGLWLVLAAHAATLVGAAAFVGLISRRLAGRTGRDGKVSAGRVDRVALWATLVGSAAFFDGFWVIAHAPALLAATAAVLGVVLLADGQPRVRGFVLAAVGTGAMVLLRSEGTLLGLALAASVGLLWLTDRRNLRRLWSALTLGIVTVAAYVGDGLLERMARPSGGTPFTIDDTTSWLSGRVTGLTNSVLRADLTGERLATLLVVVGAAGTLLAWGVVRRDARLARLAAVAGALGFVARAVLADGMIPGLLAASPLLLAGLCCLDQRIWSNALARTLIVAGALYAAAVVATQYSAGGSGDWGGRYFRLGLAPVLPVVIVAVVARARSLPRPTACVIVGSLVVASLAVSVAAFRNVREARDVVSSAVERVQQEATAAGDGRPVVVTTRKELGRFSWEHLDDSEILHVADPAELPEVAESLADHDVAGFVLVGEDGELDDAADDLAPYRPVEGSRRPGGSWTTERYRLVPPPPG